MSEESGWRRTKNDFRDTPASPERRQPGEIPEIYEFGPFRLEPAERKLLRGDEVVAVTPKAFDTLHLLVRNSGHLLEKDELIRMTWPHSVVEEGNLTNNIFLLRKALGEDAEYIETVPRKGYRFIGAVRALPKAERVRPEAAKGAGPRDPPDVVVTPVPSSAPRLGPVIAGVAATALVMLAVGGAVWWRFGSYRPSSVEAPSPSKHPANIAPNNAVAAFSPPPHSIAVLPFVNLSGDKEQEYFSDGLTEELLNSLAHIDGLQVAARTSSFSFREHPDVADVARKLNVGTVLEGSVRRSGATVRISAQLINAMTGFHVWSKTYDLDLGDMLKLQTEIASTVATALEVKLLGDVSAKIELGGTRNPAAFDAYLRGSKAYEFGHDAKDDETAIAAFSEAIRLDPNYPLAFAYRSLAWTDHAGETYGAHGKGDTSREDIEKALADARQAVTLAPELAESHVALHLLFFQDRAFGFANAKAELERALALAPGNADVLGMYGRFAVLMGHTDAGIAAARRAVTLDPLNVLSHYRLGQSLYLARRYAESVAAWNDVLVLDPQYPDSPGIRGLAYYGLGDFQNARASCEAGPDNDISQLCLALTYQRLARRADAETALAKLRGASRWAYRCAAIYAQWGNTSQALESLESAWRLRDPELRWLKADPLMDPIRKEPRFQVIERALKFPN
jgi:TolB-like protein/DNA-binding winged helix-turn-helix (wHTH) protein